MSDTATPTAPTALRPLASRLAPLGVLLLALLSFWVGLAELPVQDRDEARYVQASRQMAESGDWVDIRFQDEARHVKPAGIYWLQAITLRLTGETGTTEIWIQRLPSYIAGALASLALIWAGSPLVGRRQAVLAGVILATFYMLHAEARTAKTDAALLLSVVLAMGAMGRAWIDRAGRWLVPATFWTALSAGVLLKGPIIALPVLGGLAWLTLKARSVAWIARLRPGTGILWFLALTLPWFVAITIRTDGAFLAASIGGDLADKLVSDGVHRAFPPGFFLIALWYTFWPWAVLAPLAAVFAWRHRRDNGVALALGWLIPAWIVLEIVPTKLIHYTLPIYPALALLAGAALVEVADGARRFGGWPAHIGAVGLVLGTGIFLTIGVAGPVAFGDGVSLLSLLGALALAGLAMVGLVALYRQRIGRGIAALAAAGVAMGWTMTAVTLPAARDFWIAERMAEAMAQHDCLSGPLALAGHEEPSTVFILGTETILTDAAGALAYLAEAEGRAAWIDPALLPNGGAEVPPGVPDVTEIRGSNYTNGNEVHVRLFVSPGVPAPDDPCAGDGG